MCTFFLLMYISQCVSAELCYEWDISSANKWVPFHFFIVIYHLHEIISIITVFMVQKWTWPPCRLCRFGVRWRARLLMALQSRGTRVLITRCWWLSPPHLTSPSESCTVPHGHRWADWNTDKQTFRHNDRCSGPEVKNIAVHLLAVFICYTLTHN